MANTVIFKLGNYTILDRHTDFQPYIAAQNYDETTDSWDHGGYSDTLHGAFMHVIDVEKPDMVLRCAASILRSQGLHELAKEIEN